MSCLNNIHSACIFFGNITTEKWGSNVNTFYFSTVNLAKSFLFTLLDKKNANVHTEFNKFLSLACIKIASTTRMCGTLPQLQSYWHWHTVRVQHNHIHCEYRSHMSSTVWSQAGRCGVFKTDITCSQSEVKDSRNSNLWALRDSLEMLHLHCTHTLHRVLQTTAGECQWALWFSGFKLWKRAVHLCKYCFSCPWSKTVVNNIYEMYFRVLFLINIRDLLLRCRTVMLLQDWTGTRKKNTDGHTVAVQVWYCHMGSWVEHQCHTKDVPRTVSNITRTVWKRTEMFNRALIFYIFSTGIRSLVLTLLYIKGDILQDAYFNHVEDETRDTSNLSTQEVI